MAVYKRDIVDINLETGNIHRSFLKHSIGYKDQKADHFGIRTYRDGVPVDLTGVSVQGIFLPPQGDPIAITSGNIVDGNVAEVVLPQACYNYDGQFTLSIKLVDATNAVTGTMRIVDGMVDNTHASGTVAPTDAVPTYQEILAVYAQLLEDVTDYESVVATQDAKIDDLKSAIKQDYKSVTIASNEILEASSRIFIDIPANSIVQTFVSGSATDTDTKADVYYKYTDDTQDIKSYPVNKNNYFYTSKAIKRVSIYSTTMKNAGGDVKIIVKVLNSTPTFEQYIGIENADEPTTATSAVSGKNVSGSGSVYNDSDRTISASVAVQAGDIVVCFASNILNNCVIAKYDGTAYTVLKKVTNAGDNVYIVQIIEDCNVRFVYTTASGCKYRKISTDDGNIYDLLQNICVGADGVTYSSPGESVRTQVQDAKFSGASKRFLLSCLENLAWAVNNGSDYIQALSDALYEDDHLLYKIKEKSFSGVTADVVDTGVNVLDTDKDFTILLDVTTTESQANSPAWRVLSCVGTTYTGRIIVGQASGQSYTNLRWMESTDTDNNFTSSFVGNVRFAVRHKKQSGKASFDIKTGSGTATKKTISSAWIQSDANILLGGTLTGTSVFKGKISCKIFDIEMTDMEVSDFLANGM